MRLTLPLGVAPVTAYLFYLYPLSILAARQDYLPWLYSHFVQLFLQPGGELKFYLHPLSVTHSVRHAYLTTCPWLDVQSLDQRLVADGGEGLVPFVRRCLRRGLYVQVDADFYHIPHRPQHRRVHFLHEVLVSGVDAVGRLFQVSGFDDGGRPRATWLSWEDLERSVRTPMEAFLRDAGGNGSPPPPWLEESLLDRPRLFVYRYLPQAGCGLDLHLLAEHLGDYLASRSTAQRHRLLAPPPDTTWGLSVYDHAVALLEDPSRSRDGLAIPFRILREHKELMLSRARFLRDRRIAPVSDDVVARLECAAAHLQSLRLVLLRWERSRCEAALRRCAELLREVRAAEVEGLGELLAAVQRAAA